MLVSQFDLQFTTVNAASGVLQQSAEISVAWFGGGPSLGQACVCEGDGGLW